MRAVVLSLAVALAACYQPEVRDCVVACTGADRCAAGQACVDGVCVTPGVSCEGEAPADAAATDDAVDATTLSVDAAAPDAEPGPARLSITVEGRGKVKVSPLDVECESACSYDLAAGTTLRLEARAHPHSDFVAWSGACAGTEPYCTVTLDADAVATAHFADRDAP